MIVLVFWRNSNKEAKASKLHISFNKDPLVRYAYFLKYIEYYE